MFSHPDIRASVVAWGNRFEGNARAALAEAEDVPDKEKTGALREAVDFLNDLLSDGPKSAKECKAATADAALSWATIRRAQSKLGIKPVKDSMEGGWTWSLSQGAYTKTMSTLGNHERLGGEAPGKLGEMPQDAQKTEK